MRTPPKVAAETALFLRPAVLKTHYERAKRVICHTVVKTVQMSWQLFVNNSDELAGLENRATRRDDANWKCEGNVNGESKSSVRNGRLQEWFGHRLSCDNGKRDIACDCDGQHDCYDGVP